ncbi:hypothetical protein PPERSA_02365 [Pseudocohnilembus persalinus]|uniref:Uncharacterized protein n=1 Tax=Pseudocohnilembus persalinus TaxID=266149 RepID=A0A0V0QTV8_PSEPJ|nr:hypothetical protein PPERSA_02365 [Pseudocohnilembus persalinus]|eukprot:KRX05833.1 hypothetical protein PPERSA_02365 [Pseudocohnilembus persalinus]
MKDLSQNINDDTFVANIQQIDLFSDQIVHCQEDKDNAKFHQNQIKSHLVSTKESEQQISLQQQSSIFSKNSFKSANVLTSQLSNENTQFKKELIEKTNGNIIDESQKPIQNKKSIKSKMTNTDLIKEFIRTYEYEELLTQQQTRQLRRWLTVFEKNFNEISQVKNFREEIKRFRCDMICNSLFSQDQKFLIRSYLQTEQGWDKEKKNLDDLIEYLEDKNSYLKDRLKDDKAKKYIKNNFKYYYCTKKKRQQ